jgi:hypothetical protein
LRGDPYGVQQTLNPVQDFPEKGESLFFAPGESSANRENPFSKQLSYASLGASF